MEIGLNFARCSVCSSDLNAHFAAIQRHSNSEKHKKRCKSISNTQNIFAATEEHANIQKSVKENEIWLALFFIERDIPIAACDSLVKLIKCFDPKSQLLQSMKCDHTKCTKIIQNLIAKHQTEEFTAVLLFPALIKFFETEAKSNPDARMILNKLKNPFNLLYLQFLDFILPPVVNQNKKFQSVEPQIGQMYQDMLGLYRFILDCFIDPRYVPG